MTVEIGRIVVIINPTDVAEVAGVIGFLSESPMKLTVCLMRLQSYVPVRKISAGYTLINGSNGRILKPVVKVCCVILKSLIEAARTDKQGHLDATVIILCFFETPAVVVGCVNYVGFGHGKTVKLVTGRYFVKLVKSQAKHY